MNRTEALILLQQHLNNENLIAHSLAVEAIMRGLANNLGQDPDLFGLAGLLHDIDYDSTSEDPGRHSLVGAELLAQHGLDQDIVYAVKVHNKIHGLPRQNLMDKALYAADPLSGFITAAALVRPDKSIHGVEVKSLQKRFKEKAFAKGASREQMQTCQEIGLELSEFMEIGLASMKEIAADLGLNHSF